MSEQARRPVCTASWCMVSDKTPESKSLSVAEKLHALAGNYWWSWQPEVTAIFMLAIASMQLSRCQSAYIRAHKRDPLLKVNMVAYVMTGLGVWWFGSQYGPWGAGLAYLSVIILITAPSHIILWNRYRREWHRPE